MITITKYKAKRIDNGLWVEGVPVESVNGKFYIIHGATEDAINTQNDVDFIYSQVTPESIAKYTTINDKHNQEIYENDIVQGIENIKGWEAYKTGKVIFHSGSWVYTAHNQPYQLLSQLREIEIIK